MGLRPRISGRCFFKRSVHLHKIIFVGTSPTLSATRYPWSDCTNRLAWDFCFKELVMDYIEYRKSIFVRTNGHCAYCGKELEFSGDWHIDHMIPKYQEGGRGDNLIAACVICNSRKQNQNPDEFKQTIKDRITKRTADLYDLIVPYLEYLDKESSLLARKNLLEFLGTIERAEVIFFMDKGQPSP